MGRPAATLPEIDNVGGQRLLLRPLVRTHLHVPADRIEKIALHGSKLSQPCLLGSFASFYALWLDVRYALPKADLEADIVLRRRGVSNYALGPNTPISDAATTALSRPRVAFVP